MTYRVRNLGMSAIGLGFLGLAWGKDRLHGYATPNTVARSDTEGRIAYQLDIFAALRRFLPADLDLRGRDVLELSPGSSRGNGALFLALGARSYHAIDAFDLAGREDPGFYERLLDRFAEGAGDGIDADGARALVREPAAFGYAVDRSFDIPRLAQGRRFDLIVSCAAFEHYDSVPKAVAGLTRVARAGCETAHIIDLQTHSRWIRERDPNNIYRYSDAVYRLFRFPGQPNRQRPADYVGAFEAEGWAHVRFAPSRTIEPPLRGPSLAGLARPFSSLADMTVLDGALTGRRP